MRPATLLELAEKHRIHLPEALTSGTPPTLRATDEKGWFRFQRLYDVARSCVRDEDDVRRLVLEAAQDDARDGSRWLELQVDPTSYAVHLGGITPTLEIIQDAARNASAATGLTLVLIVAASRMRHPLDARTLARLAAHHAGDGPGGVVGFGLSNDERRGDTAEFAGAFRIARRAGLASVPHSGELLGPDHVRTTLDHLAPDRIGHGVRSVEDRGVLARDRRAGDHAGGLPGQQRGARRLRRAGGRAAAGAARGRGQAGPRGRRPAAVRVAAGRPVRVRAGRARLQRRGRWPSWPGTRSAARARPTPCGASCWPRSTPGWRSETDADQPRAPAPG